MFITFDGGDGCGKTTQILRLADWLNQKGKEVVMCRDPGSTPLGDAIRNILLNQRDLKMSSISETLLFNAARAQLVKEIIRPALEQGKIVLSDRYLLSTLAYQGYGGEVPLPLLQQVGAIATSNLLPDLGIVLDLPLEIAQTRAGKRGSLDRMESKAAEYHRRVRQGFLECARAEPDRYVVIDASDSIEAIATAIRAAVEPMLV